MDANYAQYNELAELLKVLAHPVRLCIVRGLYEKGESCNVSYLQECLTLPQSTVSQHLQKLRAAGVIEARRQGLEVYYQLKNAKLKPWIPLLFELGSSQKESDRYDDESWESEKGADRRRCRRRCVGSHSAAQTG